MVVQKTEIEKSLKQSFWPCSMGDVDSLEVSIYPGIDTKVLRKPESSVQDKENILGMDFPNADK